MLHSHPIVLDAIEVSRTRLQDRLIVAFAIDLRHVEWRPGEIAETTATVCSPDVAGSFVRLAADAAGPGYGSRDALLESRAEIPLNAVGRRHLEDAAGGFFVVAVEMRAAARTAARVSQRIPTLTVQVRERGLHASSSRNRAAA